MNRFLTLQRVATASPVAIALLVAANLVPLAGVLLFGWDLPTIVAIYWAENGVVGVFAVGRILTAGSARPVRLAPRPEPPDPPRAPGAPPPPPSRTSDAARAAAMAAVEIPIAAARFLLVPFFLVHYGLFWLVHGVFVWAALPAMFASVGDASAPGTGPDGSVVVLAACALLVSHGASFVLNWLLGGEYASSTPAAEMQAPYGRVVILHLTIILGAFGVAILGAPIGALVVMVVLKTGVDLAAHLAERKRAAARRGAERPAPEGLDAPAA